MEAMLEKSAERLMIIMNTINLLAMQTRTRSHFLWYAWGTRIFSEPALQHNNSPLIHSLWTLSMTSLRRMMCSIFKGILGFIPCSIS